MGRGTLDAIPVIDAALAGLVINVEVLEVIVEVNTASAQITAKECSMGGEHGRDVDMALSAQGDRETGLPLVEVDDDRCGQLASYILSGERMELSVG